MTKYSQMKFISNWNKISDCLEGSKDYKKLPKLSDGIFTGGVCAGLSFALEEYVKMGNEPRFYELYNLVCISSTKKIVALLSDSGNFQELIDLIYKIYILQEKQKSRQIRVYETKNEEWIRKNALSTNHLRIGSQITQKDIGINIGEVCDNTQYNNFPNIIYSLAPNESLAISIYDNKAGFAHSVTIYKISNQFHLFDPNVGEKVTVDNAQAAAKELTYCINQNLTKGTNKFTTFDRLWHSSNLFKAFAVVCIPVTLPWLIYDEFFAKPISIENLKSKRLVDSTWLSWGRVKASGENILASDDNDPPILVSDSLEELSNLDKVFSIQTEPDSNSEEITQKEWQMINRRYTQMKDNRYFGLSWLNTNKETDAIRKLDSELSDTERFKYVKNYVKKNPETTFTKAIKEVIPNLNKKNDADN